MRFKLLMFLFCPLFFLGAMAQGTPPPGGGTGGTGSESGKNDYTQGLSNVVTDLSSTLGVDLFEEDIDNVVFCKWQWLWELCFLSLWQLLWLTR